MPHGSAPPFHYVLVVLAGVFLFFGAFPMGFWRRGPNEPLQPWPWSSNCGWAGLFFWFLSTLY